MPRRIMDIIRLLSFRENPHNHRAQAKEKLYKSFIAYIIFNHPIDFPAIVSIEQPQREAK